MQKAPVKSDRSQLLHLIGCRFKLHPSFDNRVLNLELKCLYIALLWYSCCAFKLHRDGSFLEGAMLSSAGGDLTIVKSHKDR